MFLFLGQFAVYFQGQKCHTLTTQDTRKQKKNEKIITIIHKKDYVNEVLKFKFHLVDCQHYMCMKLLVNNGVKLVLCLDYLVFYNININ